MAKNSIYRRVGQGGQPSVTPRIAEQRSASDASNFDATGALNPPRAGAKVASDGSVNDNDRIYNSEGEVNAYTKREAIAQVSHLFDTLAKNPRARFDRTASREERVRKNAVLRQAMSESGTLEGMQLVAQEMSLPIKDLLDYNGLTRQILRVRTLEQGEFFRVPRDVRATALVVAREGRAIESKLEGKWILPSKFQIMANISMSVIDINELTYDALERGQETAAQEIQREEDKRTIELISTASTTANAITSFSTVGPAVLEAIRYQVERNELHCDKFLINRQERSDMVTTMAASLDPVSQREANLSGAFGQFLGATIMEFGGVAGSSNEVVPAGTIYAIADQDHLGELGIFQDVQATAYDKAVFGMAEKGFLFHEIVGLVFPNHKAAAQGVRS